MKRLLLLLAIIASLLQVSAQSTNYGTWQKSYFRDQFGDIDYNRPFMSTWIDGSRNVNLGVLFRPDGVFVFKLFDNDGDVRTIYSDQVNFAIKYNGTVLGPIKVDVIYDEIRFGGVENESMFSTLFNSGNFKISIEYESYVNRYSYSFDIARQAGEFSKAAKVLLGKTVILSSPTSSHKEEFMKHSMGDFTGTYTLRGTVGGVHCLTMKLTFNGGSINGKCKYDGDDVWHTIKGNLANLGPMVLTEYDSNGYEMWEYSGEFNGKAFRGDVIDPDRGTSEPIYLTIQ